MQTARVEPDVAHALQLAVDLIGTFVFALSGALLAVRKDLDAFGVAALSLAAGMGGGMLRDVLIGAVPPVALVDARYVIGALAAAAVGFVSHHQLERLGPAVRLFDAAGLAFFAVAGAAKASAAELPAFAAVGMGVVTAVGGGILRDVLADELPLVLRREIYAVAALLGAGVVAGAYALGQYGPVAAAVGIALTFLVRLVALRRNWNAPTAPQPPD